MTVIGIQLTAEHWIPAFAGMTVIGIQLTAEHWIPAPDRVRGRLPDRGPGHAFAGMTVIGIQLEAVQGAPQPQTHNVLTGRFPGRIAAGVAGDEHSGLQILEIEPQLLGAVPGVHRGSTRGDRSSQEPNRGSGPVRDDDGDAVVGPERAQRVHPVTQAVESGA